MRTTEIEWTEHTWNPFVGCTRESSGCANCYAVGTAARIESFGTVPHYRGVTCRDGQGRVQWSGRIAVASESVWSKPGKLPAGSLVFVNSMSDFWHPAAPLEAQRRALGIIAGGRHQYQVLTKRPANIRPTLARLGLSLPDNFWAGTTVENRATTRRIADLREVPAAIRFLSVEPLLDDLGPLDLRGIAWVIAGGESGPKARPAQASWVRSLRDQCAAQRVPFFFKQWGRPTNNPLFNGDMAALAKADPVGKGGSKLDGAYHKAWPPNYAR